MMGRNKTGEYCDPIDQARGGPRWYSARWVSKSLTFGHDAFRLTELICSHPSSRLPPCAVAIHFCDQMVSTAWHRMHVRNID